MHGLDGGIAAKGFGVEERCNQQDMVEKGLSLIGPQGPPQVLTPVVNVTLWDSIGTVFKVSKTQVLFHGHF